MSLGLSETLHQHQAKAAVVPLWPHHICIVRRNAQAVVHGSLVQRNDGSNLAGSGVEELDRLGIRAEVHAV